MRIAFTSTDGRTVDQHFGMTRDFWVWEVGPDHAGFVSRVSAPDSPGDEDGRITARADAIAGCAIVCTVQIGGPAAAKLVARRIHPMRTAEAPIDEVVRRLQQVLKASPPPWLRRAMSGGAPAPLAEE
jgi:nitrogen fixation protein NifX